MNNDSSGIGFFFIFVVWETQACRPNGVSIENSLLNPSVQYFRDVWGVSGRSLIWQSWCRESPFLRAVYTQRNLIKSTRNQIVFTILRLIWHQMDVRLVPNQSKNFKYNLISEIRFDLTRFRKYFCMYKEEWNSVSCQLIFCLIPEESRLRVIV